MRNRAKCKLCNSIIESLSEKDRVSCECDEIEVYGGELLGCAARDFSNFIRVDEEDNEINVVVQEAHSKITKADLIDTLDEMIKKIEELPPQGMLTSINHYDLCSLMILLSSIFKIKE